MSKKTNTAVSQNESKTVYQKPQIRQWNHQCRISTNIFLNFWCKLFVEFGVFLRTGIVYCNMRYFGGIDTIFKR